MDERTEGLVLRTRLLTDTSLIVHWLTPDLGRLATVAKGARRPKSPFRGKLDLFYRADFSFRRSRRSELHTLCEVDLLETHSPLRRELGYLAQASYCSALIEQTTELESPIASIFQLMCDLLEHLPRATPQPATILGFELKLLDELGLKPDVAKSALSAGSQKIVARFIGADWTLLRRLAVSERQVSEIEQFLHDFIVYHLGKIPSGRQRALTSTLQ